MRNVVILSQLSHVSYLTTQESRAHGDHLWLWRESSLSKKHFLCSSFSPIHAWAFYHQKRACTFWRSFDFLLLLAVHCTTLHGGNLFQFLIQVWLTRSTLVFEGFVTIFSMKNTFEWFTIKFGMKVLKTNSMHWSPFSPLQLALYYFRGHLFLTKKNYCWELPESARTSFHNHRSNSALAQSI